MCYKPLTIVEGNSTFTLNASGRDFQGLPLYDITVRFESDEFDVDEELGKLREVADRFRNLVEGFVSPQFARETICRLAYLNRK